LAAFFLRAEFSLALLYYRPQGVIARENPEQCTGGMILINAGNLYRYLRLAMSVAVTPVNTRAVFKHGGYWAVAYFRYAY
jgi:hypothetical protein